MPQTFTPTTGNDGRVKQHASAVLLAGITSWDLTKPVGTVPILHFESTADAKGTIWPNRLKGAGGDWKVSLAGIVNLNVTDQTEVGTTGLSDGLYVNLDLYHSKALGMGYPQCKGWIENFKTGDKVGNEAVMFTCELAGDGPPPVWGAV